MATPHPDHDVPARHKSRQIAAMLAVLAATLFALMLIWSARQRGERDALEQLPSSERRALYERTLHTLESSCDPQRQPRGLDDFCRDQADFVVQFPECDAACRTLAARHSPEPTR
jgi:hypothetical protein